MTTTELDVAIVGMSAALPGAPDVRSFWTNLIEGRCALTELGEQELEDAGVEPAEFRRSNYVRVGARLEGIERFDNEFFGISEREARLMDPQHRWLLEHGWRAFEDAGYDAGRYPGRVGVYTGSSLNTYLTHVLLRSPEVDLARDGQPIIFGNTPDYASTRLSYLLNLRGPSMTIQTACSTALVAVHEACQGLLSFQADMALAGGCSITLPHPRGYLHHEDGLFSPDGRVRAFDERARGTVFASGIALLVLKRRADAERDGDFIHALIKGSAVNNDGADKVGYAAPSIGGQAQVIRDALEIAGVDADTIEYVETHGTGTALGDPVEIRALTEAYRDSTRARQYCAIGSAKTNIGHTDVAAGAVGLIKAALALEHRVVPASLGFETANPRLELDASPFFVNARTREWHTTHPRRRAAVSSFGVGGTNAHAVLEEADRRAPLAHARARYCLTLSARTPESLRELIAGFQAELDRGDPRHDWADVCYTSNVGRRAFRHRVVVVADGPDSLRDALAEATITRAPAHARRLAIRLEGAALEGAALDGAALVGALGDAGIDVTTDAGEPTDARLLVRDGSAWLDEDHGSRMALGPIAQFVQLVPAIAGHAWRLGVGVDWERFHAGERRWRVPLPTYAFARPRRWIEGFEPSARKNPDISQWFYRPVWEERAPAIPCGEPLAGEVVLLVTASPPSAVMLAALRGARVIQVTLGRAFERSVADHDQGHDQDRYVIAVGDERSYEQLATALFERGTIPRHVIHALLVDDLPWSEDGSGFACAQELGLNSVVMLLRQLALRLADEQRLSVVVAASDFGHAFPSDRTNPDKATVIGATRTFPSEYPGIDCRVVDIPYAQLQADARAVALLVAELHAPITPDNHLVAVRAGRRWRQTFAKIPAPKTCASPVREGGVYVILGGLGELGLSLSRYLAVRARCTLVLVNSSAFVPRDAWDDWTARHDPDHAYARKIAALRAIEALGAKLRIVRCDVADRDELHATLHAATAELGSLDAIVHAAGVVENGMLAHKQIARFAEVFRAKVRGTYNLLEYAASKPGPKLVLCSSMNAIVGGLGQVDNTAANAFIDAVASTTLADRAGEVCSINWGAISSTRLAEPVVLPQFADLSREHKKNHMSEAEIRQVYDRILSWPLGPRLVVSTIDFGVVLRRWGEVGRVTELARLRRVAQTVTDSARTSDRSYRSPIHRFVVETWAGILGVAELEWDDDLLARGAHSLSAVQFAAMVKATLGLRLHAMGLYEFPRVGQLVEYLQTLQDQAETKAALNDDGGAAP